MCSMCDLYKGITYTNKGSVCVSNLAKEIVKKEFETVKSDNSILPELALENAIKDIKNYKKSNSEDLIKSNSNPKDLIGQNKAPLSLLTKEFMFGTAAAMKYGAFDAKRKDGKTGYGAYNWRKTKVRLSIYLDAILRHTMALVNEDDFDKDSGLPHEDHIAANVNIIKDAKANECLIDDRLEKREK